MPELPEVETTKTSLLPLLEQRVHAVQVRQSSLRWPIPDDLHKLVGQKLLNLTRRSKYILAQFEQDSMLWHLGMSGSFRLCEPEAELRKQISIMCCGVCILLLIWITHFCFALSWRFFVGGM